MGLGNDLVALQLLSVPATTPSPWRHLRQHEAQSSWIAAHSKGTQTLTPRCDSLSTPECSLEPWDLMASYVPDAVVQQLILRPEPSAQPILERYSTACLLMVDIKVRACPVHTGWGVV